MTADASRRRPARLGRASWPRYRARAAVLGAGGTVPVPAARRGLAAVRRAVHPAGRVAALRRAAVDPGRRRRLPGGVLQLAAAVPARRGRRPAGRPARSTGTGSSASSPSSACSATSSRSATTGSTRARACCSSTSSRMADPDRWRDRALRFADLYVDPAHGNYDPVRQIITAPHNGSGGAAGRAVPTRPATRGPPRRPRSYGFPLDWLPAPNGRRGAAAMALDDDPRLGAEMQRRLGRGDVVGNLGVGGLVLNAFLVSGEPRYADWLADVRRRVAAARRRQRRPDPGQRRRSTARSAASSTAAGTAGTTAGPGRTACTASRRPPWSGR